MVTFDISPFEGAGAIRFGMDAGQARTVLGTPDRTRTNPAGETEDRYIGVVVRYDCTTSRVCELSFSTPSDVRFAGKSLFRDQRAVPALALADRAPLEGLGLIVFPSLGIALADFFSEQEGDRAITVFARGRWKDLKGFKPFVSNYR